MATQTIEFGAPAGQTVTARLFTAGSDTVVATATATARTNATGIYTAAFTNLTPGLYRLIGTNAAGTLLCQWWVRTLSAAGTYPATETPDADSITRDRMGYLDHVLIALNSNRTVQVTGSHHVSAAIHDAEPNSIPAGALTDAAIAEIQAGLGTLDNQRYLLSILAGATSSAGTAGETYVITVGGSTYTVTYAGLDATGNRGTTAFAKT